MEYTPTQLFVVYRITSVHPTEGVQYYVGATSGDGYRSRIEAHRESDRYKDSVITDTEILWAGHDSLECLKKEWHYIDVELGPRCESKGGNKLHYMGRCLNRTTVASIPVGHGRSLCYSKARGFTIR